MTNQQILNELHQRGYDILLIHETELDYIRVQFHGKFAVDYYELPRVYSSCYTNEEIRQECAYELMHWAGYEIQECIVIK